MATIIQTRNDTLSRWTSANPILANGEIGIVTDTRKIKIGDGANRFNSLPYAIPSDVNTVNGKSGTVVLDSDDVGAETKITTQVLSATDSITLADGKIYNGGEITSLTIALPASGAVTFLCEIDFTSGSTPTTMTYPQSGIVWIGDDITSNEFVPVANKRYTIICAFDGVNYRFTVKGV